MSMVQRDPSVPGYDWSARVRTTALEALRYSVTFRTLAPGRLDA